MLMQCGFHLLPIISINFTGDGEGTRLPTKAYLYLHYPNTWHYMTMHVYVSTNLIMKYIYAMLCKIHMINFTMQELLNNSRVPRKVLFFGYMRGGSTIGGEVFNNDPSAVLWYEPLAAYYTAYYGSSYSTRPQFVLYNSDLTPM